MAGMGEGAEVQPAKVKVFVKCRPKQLCELIEKLNDDQRAAIRRIGFGGLLELKLKSFPLAHVPDFLNAFSDESYVFRASELKEFMVTKYDVYDCFMLPCGPNPVDLVPTGRQQGSQDPENKRLKDRWRKKYNAKGAKDGVNLGIVFKDILDKKYKKGGAEFCRLFVLLAMSSFLTPTSFSGIDFKLLRAVADVKSIPQYDWCSYVLENTARAAANVGTKKKWMLGCIPFLMIIYFHRFDFRGKTCPHDLPLIKHWDREKLAERLNRELDYSELGRQTWSHVKYPRCLENKMIPIAGLASDNLALTFGDTVAGSSRLQSSMSQKKFLELELPFGVEDDAKLKARAVDDVHELYLKMQRNAIVFYSWYSNAAMTLKGLTSGATPVGTGATQSFFQSQQMKDYALGIEDIAERLKASTECAPVFQHDTPCAVDLGDDQDPEEEEDVDDEEEVHEQSDDDEDEEEEEDEEETEDEEEEVVEEEEEEGETEEQGEAEEEEEECDGEEVSGHSSVASDHDFEDVIPVSFGADDHCSAEARELATKQIMDTVNFYMSDEVAEPTKPNSVPMEKDSVVQSLEFFISRPINLIYKRRKVLEKPVPIIGKLPVIEPQSSDEEILRQFYTAEEVEAYKEAAAIEEPDNEQRADDHPVDLVVEENVVRYSTLTESCGTQFLFTTADLNEAERAAEGTDDPVDADAENKEVVQLAVDDKEQRGDDRPVESLVVENVVHDSTLTGSWGTQFLFTTAELNAAERAAESSDHPVDVVSENKEVIQSAVDDIVEPVDMNVELTVADYGAKSPEFPNTLFCSADIDDAFLDAKSPVRADVQQGDHNYVPPNDVSVEQSPDGVELQFVTEEIDGAIAVVCAMQDEAVKSKEKDIAVVETKDKEHKDFVGASAELGAGMNPLEFTSTIYTESQLEQAFNGVGDKAVVFDDVPGGSAPRANTDQDMYVPRSELSHHPFLLHSSAPLSCMDHIMENLGCSIDCGAPNPDLIFATKNLEFSQSLLAPVFELRKYVMDYVFNKSDAFNRREQLVTFSEFYFVTREDIGTLNPGEQVMTSVIDGWCLLLNHIMKTGPGIVKRCFFGLSHTHPARDIWRAQKKGKVLTRDEEVFGGWENWAQTCCTPLQIDADLLFLPVLSGDWDHYSCVCINFLTEQIEYLDIRKYDEDLEKLSYGGIGRISANLLGKYLCSKGLSRGAKISNFKIVNVEFSWQGTGSNTNDCGIYMMLAMMFYEGNLF